MTSLHGKKRLATANSYHYCFKKTSYCKFIIIEKDGVQRMP